ncbi:MAG: hypothetical protein A2499_10285 [Stygiobacter sp. RIFOXYC12_FULL_38_8]|nr:MAG: hypothetical protein A2X62_11720 [Stygiobacter sp. GWC2_38_9]OGU81544.1 MAG: hypothetical protein A2279_03775 [Stygiobacter sp. RIFOXYA12_FULL_38_9]OGV08531.1 MAG: hypothetical protein A2299_16780 [Stygiobacter sp. RIFOXYB2_FULL_37_11]OGV09981.1 MAG: hypothetical protein A2237_13690 [Stygiobacter sp. RIFOXYA2_FULL_38_8]OGV12582.1 MAG: hypothetical protein A2440_15155 [Stygiobacter sp. RIFOXYC2_FULL_38_25]OGV30005.1 MAG: hypothetical protein A2499_10285 [Stygiobacter sp. RIFOXYC12_FULL_
MKTKSLPIKSKLTLRLIIASLILSLSFNLVSFAQSAAAPEKPKTNIEDALKHARTNLSMPGLFPAKVVQVNSEKSVAENKIVAQAVYDMLAKGMLDLTGESSLKKAWLKFVTPEDRIGLKVNPVAGPTLSTSVELTQAIVKQLTEAGISKDNILIWDRREEQLAEAGFTKENFSGIKIVGTERPENGKMYDENGKLYGERMIDKDWYYWADCEEKYDSATIPYMVNEGKFSYFTKIVTQMVDKIINVPILKNAGSSVTLCLKNLAYGSVTNTGRLHKQLWHETTAEVCAFAPLRDKVVLNIVDGIKGCFNGGPGANPQFFTDYKTLLIGTDAVAVDRIGYDIVIKKRIAEKIQKEDNARGRIFMDLAQKLNLGMAEIEKIQLIKAEL